MLHFGKLRIYLLFLIIILIKIFFADIIPLSKVLLGPPNEAELARQPRPFGPTSQFPAGLYKPPPNLTLIPASPLLLPCRRSHHASLPVPAPSHLSPKRRPHSSSPVLPVPPSVRCPSSPPPLAASRPDREERRWVSCGGSHNGRDPAALLSRRGGGFEHSGGGFECSCSGSERGGGGL
jgi:hypothetical protein